MGLAATRSCRSLQVRPLTRQFRYQFSFGSFMSVHSENGLHRVFKDEFHLISAMRNCNNDVRLQNLSGVTSVAAAGLARGGRPSPSRWPFLVNDACNQIFRSRRSAEAGYDGGFAQDFRPQEPPYFSMLPACFGFYAALGSYRYNLPAFSIIPAL
jgi:hypothetical protein